jgi:hypothetical protein
MPEMLLIVKPRSGGGARVIPDTVRTPPIEPEENAR